MSKLWHKDYDLNELVEKFTVGEDYLLDRRLLISDCVASAAHAVMLGSIGILSDEEVKALTRELAALIGLFHEGNFEIKRSDEDCHTAIENYLTGKLGDAGKKIHTGRSRNDQVIAALRLFSRDYLFLFMENLILLVRGLLAFAAENELIPMPGRTHMQIAMPSSVGLWAAAYAEELTDDAVLVETAFRLNDSCPLGSAASYGVPLPIDRELVARLLGFGSLQNNVLYVNNSRGKIEAIVLEAAEHVVLTLSKMAQDLILYSMPEFRYFAIPAELCSGSSIMPQKKNPCGLELVRAKAATISASLSAVKSIIKALPSGYNRDFQETKGHFMRGCLTSLECVRVMQLTIEKLEVNRDRLEQGFIPEIYATDRALELVKDGMPFREAYREVGLHLERLQNRNPVEAIKAKKHAGATGNLMLEKTKKAIDEYEAYFQAKRERVDDAITSLLGSRPPFFVFD
ncbi:MAG: argininosuccinate lyase [Spirochaetales bacterium]|nr:argininosuccinate lyase [Spirochaetales bacterium]